MRDEPIERICNGLPETAKVLDRATLIRSHVQPDLGSILHSRHQYHWHTGHVPPQTVACPHIGSWMSRVLGLRNPVMPAFVNIGQRLEGIGENEEIKAFTTAGFFGSEFGPMNLPFPEQAAGQPDLMKVALRLRLKHLPGCVAYVRIEGTSTLTDDRFRKRLTPRRLNRLLACPPPRVLANC